MFGAKTLLFCGWALGWAAGRAGAGQPVEVIPPELYGAIQPQVAVSPDGTVHVAFGKGASIYCASTADGEFKFRRPVKVGELPKLALGMRRGPRIAALDGTVVITAISHAGGDLHAWTSTDHGKSWAPAARVNEVEGSAREGLHAMASDNRATVHVCWLDLRNGKTELWGANSRDHGKTWSANMLIYKSPAGHICECCSPSIAVAPEGKVWAMWRNWLDGARDMYVAVSTNGGKTFSAGRKLGQGSWTLKACPMDGGGFAVGADGELVTAWRRERSIYASSASGPETFLGAQGAQPVVAVGPTGPLYLWQKGPSLVLKRGTGETLVFAEAGAYPVVAVASPEGASIVVWESTQGGARVIMAQRMD